MDWGLGSHTPDPAKALESFHNIDTISEMNRNNSLEPHSRKGIPSMRPTSNDMRLMINGPSNSFLPLNEWINPNVAKQTRINNNNTQINGFANSNLKLPFARPMNYSELGSPSKVLSKIKIVSSNNTSLERIK